ISYTARSGPGQGAYTEPLRSFGRALGGGWGGGGRRFIRAGDAPAPAFDHLDADDAADRAERSQGRGEQGVGSLVADAGDPDDGAEAAEADPVGPAEERRLGREAWGDPEEEQGKEDDQLEVGDPLHPDEELARDRLLEGFEWAGATHT